MTTSQPPQPEYDYDLIVIGSGPSGQRAAFQASKAGKKVAIIENSVGVGGGCLHVGTIPSKSFRESVYRFAMSSRGSLGQESEHITEKVKVDLPDMPRLVRRKDRVIESEQKVLLDQFRRNNIKAVHGQAKFISAHEIEVSEGPKRKTLSANFIFIAVGARPIAPASIKIDGKKIFDSDSILDLEKVPESMVVLGAGVIGCEYASMFSIAGTKVYLVDKRNEVLSAVDREIAEHLVQRFRYDNAEIILGTEATQLEKNAEGVLVHLANGRNIQTQVVLVALGRGGNTEGLGLETVGLAPDSRGLVKVNENYVTSVEHIYAIGDVVGAPALAATSLEQGRIASCHAFKLAEVGQETAFYTMPKNYPYGIYTIPEISMLGKTEFEAKAQGIDYVVGRARYRKLARGQIIGDQWGVLKLIVNAQTKKLIGVHIIGDNAADLIHIGQAVMNFDGDVSYFIANVFNYPTLAEAYKSAAFQAINLIRRKNKHHPESGTAAPGAVESEAD